MACPTASRADIEEARARDRTNVLARLIQATLSHTVTLDDTRATVAAPPEDWRALRLLELAQHGTPRRRASPVRRRSAAWQPLPSVSMHRPTGRSTAEVTVDFYVGDSRHRPRAQVTEINEEFQFSHRPPDPANPILVTYRLHIRQATSLINMSGTREGAAVTRWGPTRSRRE